MKTLIFIHGGESFKERGEYKDWIKTTLVEWNIDPYEIQEEKRKWKTELVKNITSIPTRIYMPNFPNPQNAIYEEWKLFFEIWINKANISGNVIFIGTSLGGCFLLKYFSEIPEKHFLMKSVESIHLIAACIEAGDFIAPTNYKNLDSLEEKIHIWHAENDTVVPFSVAKELEKILPKAQTHFFGNEKGYGHFHKLERFIELEGEILKT